MRDNQKRLCTPHVRGSSFKKLNKNINNPNDKETSHSKSGTLFKNYSQDLDKSSIKITETSSGIRNLTKLESNKVNYLLGKSITDNKKNTGATSSGPVKNKQSTFLAYLEEKNLTKNKSVLSHKNEASKKKVNSLDKSNLHAQTGQMKKKKISPMECKDKIEENPLMKKLFAFENTRKIMEEEEKMEVQEKRLKSQEEKSKNDSLNSDSSKRKKKSRHFSLEKSSQTGKEEKKASPITSNVISNLHKLESPEEKSNEASISINKKNFYSDKKHVAGKKSKRKDTVKETEDPVLLILSSDDEDEENTGTKSTYIEPRTEEANINYDEELFSKTSEDFISLNCKTVFIGSYKVTPKARLKITKGCFTMVVPTLVKENPPVTLIMKHIGIVEVAANMEEEYPVFFLYIKPTMAKYIVNKLRMSCNNGPFIDPLSEDEHKHRIVIFTESIRPELRESIKEFWTNLPSSSDSPLCFVEISSEDANDIIERIIQPIEDDESSFNCGNQESKKLFIYPPPPQKEGITITTNDYCCLEEEQFLNDVIIDFYLKWLMENYVSEKDRERTHVFSTFFYKRLTLKPKSDRARSEETSLTPGQRRHARVQSWTKNVDIFSKDFIFVPINEHSHWFLAIICFPGLDGPIRLADEEPSNSESNSGSTTGKTRPVKTFQVPSGSSHDKGSGFLHNKKKPNVNKDSEPIKQPCILIFNSLSGGVPNRIVATLRDYLAVEYEIKKKKKKAFDKYTMKGACPKVPRQENLSDCGLYTLQYAQSFFQHPLKDFRFPIRSLMDWFSKDIILRKRQIIADLIKSLVNEYNVNENIKLPKLLFGSKMENKETEKEEKLSEVRKHEGSKRKENKKEEKLSEVRKHRGSKRKHQESNIDTNDDTSLSDSLQKLSSDNCSSLSSSVQKDAKRMKLDSCKEDTLTTLSSKHETPLPSDVSDDNDSGHHSDADDSRECESTCKDKKYSVNSENNIHKPGKNLESKSKLVDKSDSFSLTSNFKNPLLKSYERVKKEKQILVPRTSRGIWK